jgi:hypothetical protein
VAGRLIQGNKLLLPLSGRASRPFNLFTLAGHLISPSITTRRSMMLVLNQFEFSQSVGFKSFTIQRETSVTCEIQSFIY